ncbi:hypothetical protein H2200_009087 [Cladophialophora chaetospira]|uniref:Synembryn-like protein C3E7.04c n=1 Tax=Cladophialophora chaetospira TaxID=386627 RepID=A0AA38X3F8_9EURO|nr:hypothetical protein H2200_009087 [Cladophialophora chaetospira]
MPNQAQQKEATALLASLVEGLETKTIKQERVRESLERLKILGRDVNKVSAIYNVDGIKTLGSYAFENFSPSVNKEALRCLANALLLLPTTRQHSIKLGLDKKATDALRDVTDDSEFVLSRILFLLTYDPGIDIDTLLSNHELAENIIKNLSRHAEQMRNSDHGSLTDQSTMALIETLKLLFNVTSRKTTQASKFNPATSQILAILERINIMSPPLQPPVSLLINALANLDIDVEQMKASGTKSAIDKLILVLERAVQALPATELETAAIPLLTTLRNLNAVAPPDLRDSMKSRLLPDNEERDQPLGKSSSLASQLLRLTTSSAMIKLSEAISGLMFELSDKDASQYVQNVGYGYAAGYLMTHKIPIPENVKGPQGNEESFNQIPINPITGQRLDKEPTVDLPEMTQEEKEREAERLFVLFERLKATGVVDVQNPVDVARDSDRFEELSDED